MMHAPLQGLAAWLGRATAGLDPVATARVRSQHLIAMLFVVLGIPYVTVFVALDAPLAGYPVLAGLVLSAVALFVWTRRGQHRIGGMAMSLAYFGAIAVCLIGRGGMTSNSAAWVLLAPVLASLLAGVRHGAVIGVASIVWFGIVWGLEAAGVAMPEGLPGWIMPYMPLVDYSAIAMAIGWLMWVQAGIWDQTIERLDEINGAMRLEVVEREEAEGRARDAARARSTFLATMSHEIRTPLNGILGLTEVMLGGTLDPEQRQLAGTVHRSGALLRAILDDVLDFSKIDSGHLELEMRPVHLRELCEDVLELWRQPAHERGVELAVRWAEGTPRWVTADPTRLRQILGNLVSNALKFTERGHVYLSVEVEGRELVIAVEDTGIGMSPEAAARVFEPFRQADSSTSRKYGGTGLGLAICRRLSVAMDGDLQARSEPGVGTTFTLRLPLVVAAPPTMEPAVRGAVVRPGLTILLAEDNDVNQMVMRRMLARHDVEVHVAGDGFQAIERWREGGVDLILMDCQMPGCDGYAATEAIREAGGSLPIIAVTANTMPGDRARCIDAGMDDHLGKPVRMAELDRVLARWAPTAQPTGRVAG